MLFFTSALLNLESLMLVVLPMGTTKKMDCFHIKLQLDSESSHVLFEFYPACRRIAGSENLSNGGDKKQGKVLHLGSLMFCFSHPS